MGPGVKRGGQRPPLVSLLDAGRCFAHAAFRSRGVKGLQGCAFLVAFDVRRKHLVGKSRRIDRQAAGYRFEGHLP